MSVELDPKRVEIARQACEDAERRAEHLETEARRIRASATAMRQRWGLPPASNGAIPSPHPPEWPPAT